MYFLQEKLLFFPESLPDDYQFSFAQSNPAEEIWLKSREAELHGLLFSSTQAKGVVLYFHGNAGSLRDWGQVAGPLSQHGFHVLAMDYRSYGKSKGPLSEKALRRDAVLAYQAMKARFPHLPILVYGRSLGSAMAIEIAAHHPIDHLLLETPYRSIRQTAQEHYGWVPVALLIRYPLDNEPLLSQIQCPVSIIHGTLDKLISHTHSEFLADQLSHTEVNFVLVEGGGHNDLGAHPEYESWLTQAFSSFQGN